MLYHNLNRKKLNSNQSSNITSSRCNQVLLLTDNKLFTLTQEEIHYINLSLDNLVPPKFTLSEYTLKKKALTKIMANYSYQLRNRKKIQINRYEIDKHSSSDSNYSLVKERKNQQKEDVFEDDDDNDDNYDPHLSVKRRRNKDKDNIVNKAYKAKKANKKKKDTKSKYSRRFNKIISDVTKEEDNNNNEEEEEEDEVITKAQAHNLFVEMYKVLSKKQDKKQLKLKKEEEKKAKREKIVNIKKKIEGLSLSQVKELYNEFIKGENERNEEDNTLNFNFEIMPIEQIDKFIAKIDIYENLNMLNKGTHKTFREELELIKQNKEAKNSQSIIQISGKTLPFLDDDVSSSSDSSDVLDSIKSKNEEMADFEFNNNNNNLPQMNAVDEIVNSKYSNKKIVDDEYENDDFCIQEGNESSD